MPAGPAQRLKRAKSAFIGPQERHALMSLAMAAAMAAGDIVSKPAQRYADCALRLLQAAIGDPITLGEAQELLERWALLDTPLEESFSQAILAIKTRRQVLEDASFGEGGS